LCQQLHPKLHGLDNFSNNYRLDIRRESDAT